MSDLVTYPTYTCSGAQYICDNKGYKYVNCEENAFPGQMQSARLTCDRPTTEEKLQRRILSGVIGAIATGAIAYSIDKERALPAAALGGALGLLFGGYI